MSYFQLHNIPYNEKIEQFINFKTSDKKISEPVINKTLVKYLTNIKTEIDNRQEEWDHYKKYINPYEYIHTQVSNTKTSVCKIKPLSRSYFKMIEICGIFNLIPELPDNCKSFHLAEGPGGFIEALSFLRNNVNDSYVGMTLIDNDINVPGWKKSTAFLEKHKNVYIEKGLDNTGNLLSLDNLKFCHEKYKGSIDLVTADGGFDFSIDFNSQETVSANLILCQIIYAIAVQKKGGNFFIKFFDTFTEASLQMIYLLALLYEEVYFVKPNTSRYANSEKYIVCKKFKLYDTSKIMQKIFTMFTKICYNENIISILSLEIPYLFTNQVEGLNAIYGQQQLDSISNTLNLINNNKPEKIESIKKNNIQKCVSWCQKYNLPFNKINFSNNIKLNQNI
tara:strand:+ start:7932 stop:9110 length:1179 start_codon:yes stop_codon:yes gene_type:complete